MEQHYLAGYGLPNSTAIPAGSGIENRFADEKKPQGAEPHGTGHLIWIAVSVYVLVAIDENKLHFDASLYKLQQFSSVSLFEGMPLQQALPAAEYIPP